MRYEGSPRRGRAARELLVVLALMAIAAGCEGGAGGIADRSMARRRLTEQPAQVIDPEAQAETDDPETAALMEALLAQQQLLTSPGTPGDAEAGPAGAALSPDAPPSAAGASAADASPGASSGAAVGSGSELSVEHLTALLAAKARRTPAEEEAYRRLVGLSRPPGPPAANAGEYTLLGQAREALLAGRADEAQRLAVEALTRIRLLTDPTIDRVVFAMDVRNYGDADAVSPAEFRAGETVMVVTDLSNFACLPVAGSTESALFYTKMSQRLAIYDMGGRLYWQQSYGAFEYQASHYVSTMFIPRIFNLPTGMGAGEYIIKVEISDMLAGRQTEGSARFSVR